MDSNYFTFSLSFTDFFCVKVSSALLPSIFSSDLHLFRRHASPPRCGATTSAIQPLRLMRRRLQIEFHLHMRHPSLIQCTPTPPSFPLQQTDQTWPRKDTFDQRVQINKGAGWQSHHLVFYDPRQFSNIGWVGAASCVELSVCMCVLIVRIWV